MKASELKVGDVVTKLGKVWRHEITLIDGLIYTRFSDNRPSWMSDINMQSILEQPDTAVHRDGVQIHPPTDAGGEGV